MILFMYDMYTSELKYLAICQMDRARTLRAAEHFMNGCPEVVEMVVEMVKFRD